MPLFSVNRAQSMTSQNSFCMIWISNLSSMKLGHYLTSFRICSCSLSSLIFGLLKHHLQCQTNVAEPDRFLGNLLFKHDCGSSDRDRHSSWCCCLHLGTCQSFVGWSVVGFCPVCDKRQLFTALHLTYSLTPRSLSPTPTSPCSPCSPLHAFHFWR